MSLGPTPIGMCPAVRGCEYFESSKSSMTQDIFLIDQNNRLSELAQAPYDSEAVFQALLADHPALIRAIGSGDGRLLLVRREASVPGADGETGRWSLDHLFLDGDGVPVLVEVKRATDTRIRREVVSQMLDYAANGVAYWPIDQIIAFFAATAEAGNEDPDTALAAFIGSDERDNFWRRVEANLRAGRVRMVFVADSIPPELQRIVEFLNEQMSPAEVLDLEIEQYVTAENVRVLAPRVIGRTLRADSKKDAASTTKPKLNKDEWLATLAASKGEEVQAIAGRILEWSANQELESWVTESQDSIAISILLSNGKRAWPFFIRRSTARSETSLQYLAATQAFSEEAKRAALLDRFRMVQGMIITKNPKSTSWPAIPLIDLNQAESWYAWQAIGADIVAALRGS